MFRSTGEPAQRTVTAETKERVLAVVENNPKISTRRVAVQLGISHWTAWKVLKDEGMHPFHTLQVQELKEEDKPRRVDFCRFLQNKDDRYLEHILWSDESMFTREGIFNTHNDHTWSVENPRAVKETRHQRRFSVNVWAGIIGQRLIGPHIFEETLNGERYLRFLEENLPVLLEDVPLRTRRKLVFQQDGAPPHWTLRVRDFLTNTFREPWIGRNGPVLWPPRSPDLTPLDFFLWGYMKDLVYSTPIESREQLIDRIFEAAEQVKIKLQDINLVEEVKRRCAFCVECEGGHFEQRLK